MEWSPKRTVYVVREQFTREYGDQPPAVKSPAVWAFPELEQATACRQQLEREAWQFINPFTLGGTNIEEWTSLDQQELLQRLRGLGLKLGLECHRDHQWWVSWWRSEGDQMTPQAKERLWSLFDKLHCYAIEPVEVDAEPLKQRVYVVQRLCWQYNDNWNDLANDEPVKAFRDRERAEIYRLEFEEPAREQARNPCRYAGALEQASSLDSAELIARLQQLGAPLPAAGPTDMQDDFDFRAEDWWDRLWDELPRRQWHNVYDLFDKVRFYEVVEVETDG